jgi:hypothetical protein
MPANKSKTSPVNNKRQHVRVLGKMRDSRYGFAVFGLVFAAIGGYVLLFASHAAPTAPSIYITPSTKTYAANATFTVQVRENSGATSVNAVQANFSYPASLLTFQSIDTTGTAFSTIAPSSGGNGSVNLAQGVIGGTSGDQLIATITFKAGATGGSAALAFTSGTVVLNSSTNADILGSLANAFGANFLIDTTAPTVSITSPANGASISSGSTQTVSVTATDNDSVSSVDFYIDGAKVSTLTAPPYNYSWNTTGVALGNHTLQAKATDPSGNLGSSTLFTVSVADKTPPTVSITSPSNSTVLKGTVNITANAADNAGGTGVSKVEFYVDGLLKSTDTSSPYAFSWDSTTASNASHSLTATAYDGAVPANSTTSGAVSVTVDNSSPTTPGALSMTGNTFTSISLSWGASTDNIGVTGYRISRNGNVLATTSAQTLTYTDSGLATGTSYNYSVVALDAVGNASAASSLTASTVASKIGDLNADNQVDITDLSILLSNWNTSNAVADINKDGTVNITDLSMMLSHWGT